MLGLVNDVIQQLDVDTGRARVAVVSFHDTAQVRQYKNSQLRYRWYEELYARPQLCIVLSHSDIL